jgi:hypothetical protein
VLGAGALVTGSGNWLAERGVGAAAYAAGTRPAHWVPDAERHQCSGCGAEFGGGGVWRSGKHHCRGCGEGNIRLSL